MTEPNLYDNHPLPNERRTKLVLFGVVIALPLVIGLVNLVAFLWIAKLHPDDRVADDFYKKALAVHKNDDAAKLAQALGIRAALEFNAQQQSVQVRLTGQHQAPPQLSLLMVHPVDSSQDVRSILLPSGEGVYQGHFEQDLSRFAQLRLEPIPSAESAPVNATQAEPSQTHLAPADLTQVNTAQWELSRTISEAKSASGQWQVQL